MSRRQCAMIAQQLKAALDHEAGHDPASPPPPEPQPRKRSEGVRRLSLAVGGVACLIWSPFLLVIMVDNQKIRDIWALFTLGSYALAFFVPWSLIYLGTGLVRLVAWVVAGFRLDRERP